MSATEQTSVSSCCVTGHIHQGEPLGQFEILHGLRTYVSNSHAPTDGSKQNVVILLPDIFGVDLVNTKLVADEWAGQGYKALLPDVFEGDAIDIAYLKDIAPRLEEKQKATLIDKAASSAKAMTSLGPWLVKHREAVAKPIVEKFVQAVRADPSTDKIAAVGFCWGGRYSLILAQEDSPARVDVAVANHPSFAVVGDVSPIISVPVAILKGTEDDVMSDEQLDEVEGVLQKNLGQKLLVKRFPDAVHGFTVRGDLENATEKSQKEEANKIGFEFVAKWFGSDAAGMKTIDQLPKA